MGLTDCFYVKDIIFIELCNKDKLKINASFQINFTKNTIWKRIIQLNTNNAFKQFLIGYTNMIQKYQQQRNNNDNNAYVSLTNAGTRTSYSSSTRSSSDDYNDIDSSTTFEQ